MKYLFAVLTLMGLLRAQVLGRVRTRTDLAHRLTHSSDSVSRGLAATTPHTPRQLIEIGSLKNMLEGIVRDLMWTVGEPVENTVGKAVENVMIISEKVGETEVAIFRANLTEVTIEGSTQKRQYLTLENRPTDKPDDQFKRYKRAQLMFRRKFDSKDSGMMGAFIRHSVDHFKNLCDRLAKSGSVSGILMAVESSVNALNVPGGPGLQLAKIYTGPQNAYFEIKDGSGNLVYSGNIYRVSADYTGLALWATDESVYIYSGYGTETDFQDRLRGVLVQKVRRGFPNIGIRTAQGKVLEGYRQTCAQDFPAFESQLTGERHYIARLAPTAPNNPKGCIYGGSKIVLLEYKNRKLHFFHLLADLKDLQTEDMLVPSAVYFDNLLRRSLKKNFDAVDFIRTSRSRGAVETVATSEKIRKVLVGYFNIEPTDEPVDDSAKALVEVDNRKWLHSWRFGQTVLVKLYQNSNDFILELAKPDAQSGSITTTTIALPVYNSYDHVGLIGQQVKNFMQG